MVATSEQATTNPFKVHFGERAIEYCVGLQRRLLEHYQVVLVNQYPDLAEDIERAAEAAMTGEPSLPLSGFKVVGSTVIIGAVDHRYLEVPLIGQVIQGVNRKLGVWEYLEPLVSVNATRSDLSPFNKRYPWNRRLAHIQKAGDFSKESPVLQFMAVASAGQAATNIAREEGQRFISTSENAVAVNGLTDYEGIRNFLNQRLFRVRQHQAFIKECSATLGEIAEKGQFTQDRQQLLLDLIFIHKDGLEKESEFDRFFNPIVELVKDGNWQEAEGCRDFLLHSFPGLFPDWRQRENGVEPAGFSAKSIDQLAGQISAGEVTLGAIPRQYAFLKDRLPQSMDRAQKERNRQILKDGIDVSATMVEELARELAKRNILQSQKDRNTLIEAIPRGDVLDDIFNKLRFTERKEEDWERFASLIDSYYLSGVTADSLRWFFDDMRRKLTPPYELRAKSARRVAILKPIEFQNDKSARQVYLVSPPDDYGDFGSLLSEIIEASFIPSRNNLVLSRDEVRSALIRAWNRQERKPAVTFKDYLTILVKPISDSPAAQFIGELD